ncbi:MAG: cytidylate kinase-like family protein [Elusimicrobia bacterium]|nr:cytidylate kinase-like family protein [Elusimicrobiota bacterium]
MNNPESVLRFLKSEAFETHPELPAPGARPFVTISRQAGAGGRSLAEALLRHFAARQVPELSGWHWMDRELCENLAADPRLGVSMESLLDERFRGRLEDFLSHALSGSAPQIQVHRALFSTMRSLAAVGRVVLIGRGGVCATRGFSGGIHVRLVGSRSARIERAALRRGRGRAEAECWVDEQDKARTKLLKEYFGASAADPLLYDMTCNTDLLAPDEIAEAVAGLVLMRTRTPAHA